MIRSVEIKNFRCFKNAKIDLTSCHALVGENGTGKTAILEAIDFVTSSGYVAGQISEQDFNNEDVGNLEIIVTFDKPFVIKYPDGYSTKNIPCSGMRLAAHRREKAAPGKAFSDPFVIEHHAIPIAYYSGAAPVISDVELPDEIKKTDRGYEISRQTGSTMRFTDKQLTLQYDTLKLPNVFYFDKERERQTKVGFNSLMQKIGKDLNWRFRKNWDQGAVNAKWDEFYRAVISTVEDPKNERIIRPLQEKMRDIVGIDLAALELSFLEIEQPFSKIFFSKREGTNQIEQKRLGSGISILLAYFLLEIVSKLSKEEIVFLIDEPEMHLHPQMQQKLFSEFQKAESQVMYTTHSDHFVDISEWRSITRFQNDYDFFPKQPNLDQVLEGQTIAVHLDEIKRFHQHKSIFLREDNQIFFARKCLLVEGPAEKYGIPVLAHTLNIDLGDLTMIACHGKTKLPYYQLLCRAYGIPYYTLFDLDGKSATEDDNARPTAWSSNGALSTCRSSFEELLSVSSNNPHKCNVVLSKVDACAADQVPNEIKTAITAIAAWSV